MVCVGSYTPDAGGRGIGITTFWQDTLSGELEPVGSLEISAPSYLTFHPDRPVLYSVSELAEGTVTALAADERGALRPLASKASGGAAPCHLAVTPDRRYLLCANYGGGSLAVFRLDGDGGLGERTDLVTHSGSGKDPVRQDGPHVHMVVPHDQNDLVSVVDLGTDEIHSYRLSSTGRLSLVAASPTGDGSGPRHLVRDPASARAYVVGELASTLMVLDEAADGVFTVRATMPATIASSGGINFPAHLALSGDGRFLYVSNRGADRITVFATDRGELTPVAEYPSGGAWPRHFALAERWLYVANQNDDVVAAFDVDTATGALSASRHYPVASPTCVAVAPW